MTFMSGPPYSRRSRLIFLARSVPRHCEDHARAARSRRKVCGLVVVTTWACGNLRWMRAAGDQPGEMGDVDGRNNPDGVADGRLNRAKSLAAHRPTARMITLLG